MHSHSEWHCMVGHRSRHGSFMGGAGFRGARMLASNNLQLAHGGKKAADEIRGK